ncbi:MAG: prephenate dehydrogenase/arogenate dehydrogenase family protein [Anaerolineales bacterium]|nr:prephenate dehydrogenase/arogenate dehydrogenase family protein [Anaerolineales bacterium]
MDKSIALVGLDVTGQSIGLALRQAGVDAQRVGHDKDGATARQAQEAGAVDRLEASLKSAASQAPLAVVSVPAWRLASTLEELAAALPADAVVLDASPLKQPALQALPQLRSAGIHYIGLTPAVNGDRLQAGEFGHPTASADRFRGGVLGVILPPGTPQEALDLALQMAALLQATPYFLEAGEADACAVLSDELPSLLSTALMHASLSETAWREVRRTAGPPFVDMVSLGLARPSEEIAHVALAARTSTLEKLDHLMLSLQEIRRLVEAGDEPGLQRIVKEADTALRQLLQARIRSDWAAEEVGQPVAPAREAPFARLFGFRRPSPRA